MIIGVCFMFYHLFIKMDQNLASIETVNRFLQLNS